MSATHPRPMGRPRVPVACVCTYSGQQYQPGSIIYDTTDGMGGCITARCEVNGTIHRTTSACSPTTAASSTPFSFSTAPPGKTSRTRPGSALLLLATAPPYTGHCSWLWAPELDTGTAWCQMVPTILHSATAGPSLSRVALAVPAGPRGTWQAVRVP